MSPSESLSNCAHCEKLQRIGRNGSTTTGQMWGGRGKSKCRKSKNLRKWKQTRRKDVGELNRSRRGEIYLGHLVSFEDRVNKKVIGG